VERITTRGRVDKWHERKHRYLTGLISRGITATLGARRGARWARTPHGMVGILGASDVGDRWWFGLKEREFNEYGAVGLILLCESRDDVLDFGLSAERVRAILPRLGSDRRAERKLNLLRRGERYLLQIPSGDPVDMTDALHDLTWLGDKVHIPSVEGVDTPEHAASTAGPESSCFFAQMRRGVLKPLDRIGLKDGEVVLVQVTRVMSVPSHPSLRRIVAAGSPSTLPADFASQHDFYAHGARRR
jgi:hypothetical protein